MRWRRRLGTAAVVAMILSTLVSCSSRAGDASEANCPVEDGELFRALLPALPAYGLLFASLPLLVPTLAARLGPLARPA